MLELAETLVGQNPVVLGVEQAGGGHPQRWRAIPLPARKCTLRLPSLRRYSSENAG